MLYNLLYPLSVDYSILNIFKYITFRSAWALVTALAVSILVGPYFIRWLQAIKCRQEILKEVKAHQCKAGTPTMGGLLIVFAVSVSVLLWADLTNAYVWMTMLVFIGFSAVGFIDDFMKVSHHQNKGLSPRAKFAGQMLVADRHAPAGVGTGLFHAAGVPVLQDPEPGSRVLVHPVRHAGHGGDFQRGESDGRARRAGYRPDGRRRAGVFGVYLHHGHVRFAQYLQLEYISGWARSRFSAVRWLARGLGSWFNAYPAQMFMGDVGSLGLGGVLAFLAVLCKQELLLLIVGGLFVAETLSVILQVSYFKAFGREAHFSHGPAAPSL